MKPQTSLKNMPRPAAFIQVKHAIMSANDNFEIKQAEKMVSRYILEVCEKELREQRMLDLQYILEWKISQMANATTFEDPIDALMHKRLEAK